MTKTAIDTRRLNCQEKLRDHTCPSGVEGVLREKTELLRLNDSLQKELTQMGDHAARLRVCLLRYGKHYDRCAMFPQSSGKDCDCGLEANIEAVPGEMLTSNDIKPSRPTILKGLWQLLRAYAGGGMPPLITKGIRLACQNVGMSEDHIASAELGGDDPDFIKQEMEKRNDAITIGAPPVCGKCYRLHHKDVECRVRS